MRSNKEKELLKLLRIHRNALKKLRGVHYVDIGYKYIGGIMTEQLALRIHVYAKHMKPLLKHSSIPKKIGGVPTDVIVSYPIKNHRFGRQFTTLQGGIEIGNIYNGSVGTLGALFKDEIGLITGLTNYHVLFGRGGKSGDDVSQPQYDHPESTDLIGKVLRGNEDLDCAIFRINNRRYFDHSIFQLTPRIQKAIQPAIGDPVVKSGIATDLTFGVVDGTDGISYRVCQNPYKPNIKNHISDLGDSGSIWLADDSVYTTGVGLHYGGDIDGNIALFYDLNRVMKKIGITFLKP